MFFCVNDLAEIGNCRGIAPNEGTEISKKDVHTRKERGNCRGIAPIEGTEIWQRDFIARMLTSIAEA